MRENSMEQKRLWKKRYRKNRNWKVAAEERRIKERNEGVFGDDGEEERGKRMEKNVAIMWQRNEKEKSLFLIHKANAWS